MGKFQDLTNLKFGNLKVLRRGSNVGKSVGWLVACSCGSPTKTVAAYSLSSGHTKSCGCRERMKHGHHADPAYNIWKDMVQRCSNPKHKAWSNYGGRGIKVCKRWLDISKFIADMCPRPSNLQLDRKDNSKGYNKSNCHWVTSKENNNNRRNTVWVSYQGRRMRLTDALELSSLNPHTVRYRIAEGWANPFAPLSPKKGARNNTERTSQI